MTTDDDRSHFKEVCPTCGKKIAQNERAGSLTSYLFQPFYCSCLGDGERLMPLAGNAGRTSRSRISFGRDSLGSFCPACGLQSMDQGTLGSITGFLFQDMRCKCQVEAKLSGDDMVERFFKLKEAEADKVFASVTVDVSKHSDPRETVTIDLLPGAIIGGVYRIVRLIGKGGMGEVYLANHTALAKTCALKLIPPHQVTDSSWKRFQNEAKTIAGLDHVNLVKVTDLGIHEGCLPYYAMEYLDGESLADWLKARGPLPLKTVLDIFQQVCDGVDYAHRKGVVHRDLKPGNIMLMRTRSGGIAVKILDFGLVKLTQKDRAQQSLTRVGEVFGTPFYMSPEQCIGGRIDNRSDVYSVGCTMFEALTGQVPFNEKSPVETITAHQVADPPTLESLVGPNVFPASMEVVIAKLLRKNPVERYQTLSELRHDLEKVGRGEEVEPYYVSRTKVPLAETQILESIPAVVYGARSAGKRNAILAASIFLLAVIGLGAVSLVVSKQKEATVGPEIKPEVSKLDLNLQENLQDNLPEAKAAKLETPPPSIKDTAPYSEIVTSNGKKMRRFNFASDANIGKIYSNGHDSREARGMVEFPADAELHFMPELAALKWPAYLKRFRSGDIHGLVMSKFASAYALNGSQVCLEAMTQIPGAKSLDLRSSEDLPAKSIEQLDRFTDMKSILLGRVRIDTEPMAGLKILKNLNQLFLSGPYDVKPIVLAMAGSNNMQKLSLPTTSVDLEMAESLASMPNLTHLYLESFNPNDVGTATRILRILSKNEHLEELSVKRLILRPETISVLGSFKSLNCLRCDQITGEYAKSLQMEVARQLPRVQFGAPFGSNGKLPRN